MESLASFVVCSSSSSSALLMPSFVYPSIAPSLGANDIKSNPNYTILRHVFDIDIDMARNGGDDWVEVEDRFYYSYS